MPINIIPWQAAITKLFQNRVTVLSSYDREVRSLHMAIQIPAVVLSRGRRNKKRRSHPNRKNVLARDGYMCQYMGCKTKILSSGVMPFSSLTMDHVVPLCKGGKTVWVNCITACFACNQMKGCLTLEESGMVLKRKPREPSFVEQIRMMSPFPTIPEVWQPYLNFCNEKGTAA